MFSEYGVKLHNENKQGNRL